ncbi:MAG: phenylalanine--tRNA ligase subunit beta, partial [Solirubrobacterales bacterium]
DGALTIRTARGGEKLRTLDGVERSFDAETVLVCDATGPAAIAGIMGGGDSEVSETTTRVLLEAANWNGQNVLRTSNRLSLRSEASTRFEKQLHPELTMRAQHVASRMLVELCGARLVPGTIDVAAEAPAAHTVRLRGGRAERLLGMPMALPEEVDYLTRLGFSPTASGEDLDVGVPADRYEDITREADLIEEVARLHGLDRLPSTLPTGGNRSGRLARADGLRRRVEDALRDIGFNEIVAWSFNDAALADRLRLGEDSRERKAIGVSNPLSEEGSYMRTTLLGGLLDAARHNLARGAERALLFESGRVYLDAEPPESGGPLAGVFPGKLRAPAYEPHRIGALAVGSIRPPSWQDGGPDDTVLAAQPEAGFFELKGVLEDACRAFGVDPRLAQGSHPFLHPGRAAQVELGGVDAGWIGELHPLVAAAWDLPGGFAFELDLAVAGEAGALTERFSEVASFPAVYQDIAVVVPEETRAEQVVEAVSAGAGELLGSARVFDLYIGDQLGAGRKSLALRLEFRATDRTLTDEEIAERREAIRSAVGEIGGALRE